MRWWQVPLFIVCASLGVYLWSVPSQTFARHVGKLWSYFRRKGKISKELSETFPPDAAVVADQLIPNPCSLIPAFLRLGEPSALEPFLGDTGEVGLDVEDRGAVEHVETADAQRRALASQELDHG